MSAVTPQPRETPPSILERLLADAAGRSEAHLIDACATIGAARKMAREAATVDLLTALTEQLEALSRIQHMLRFPAEPVLDLSESLCDLCGHMVEARFAARGIFIHLRAASIVMDSRIVWSAMLIVSELLLHICRHGFPTPPGMISIGVRAAAETATIEFQDDGSARRLLRSGDGHTTRTTLELIADNAGCTFEFPGSVPCTTVLLKLPLSAYDPMRRDAAGIHRRPPGI